jgi:hypothetical protein
MRFISHRGNIDGREMTENHPSQIDFAIHIGLEVEVDVWEKDGWLWLGHDRPMFKTKQMWLADRHKELICHAKNPKAAIMLEDMGMECFGHHYDAFVVSNVGDIILHPKAKYVEGCVVMLPEMRKKGEDYSKAEAICSDYISLYAELYG